ncbi:nodulin MtN21 /EamA-like transporter family protein [Actinidia rufa]|uniref:Nodulin MtN21 /EamA-like transporter family protein n=1 Tax=Actinidia rufa TaxID=165716 RepID=A0A7J0FBB9_9ERIC|nr:nodulin MtN21 /EamA-like transporter family protein [Actinidia rufa]
MGWKREEGEVARERYGGTGGLVRCWIWCGSRKGLPEAAELGSGSANAVEVAVDAAVGGGRRVECTNVGLSNLSKAAMTKGISSYVFVVYYNALSTVILFPIVFGRMKRASQTISLVCSLLGPLGSFAQMLASIGLKFCSPTLKFAMNNLTQYTHICLPSYSGNLQGFVPQWCSNMVLAGEGPCLCSHVQPVGDCHCCGHGSLVPWGSPLSWPCGWSSNYNSWVCDVGKSKRKEENEGDGWGGTWKEGGSGRGWGLEVVSWWRWTTRRIAEAAVVSGEESCKVVANLPENRESALLSRKLVGNAPQSRRKLVLICRKLAPNSLAGAPIGHGWCDGGGKQSRMEKGPVYVTMFRSLGIAIAVVTGVLYLRNPFYLGSVVGAVIITLGFYVVMWGKAKEMSYCCTPCAALPIQTMTTICAAVPSPPYLFPAAMISSPPQEGGVGEGLEKEERARPKGHERLSDQGKAKGMDGAAQGKRKVAAECQKGRPEKAELGWGSAAAARVLKEGEGPRDGRVVVVGLARRRWTTRRIAEASEVASEVDIEDSGRNQRLMEWWSCVRRALPLAAMITVECTAVGLSTLSKAAMTKGMSTYVFIVYYNALSTIILFPFIVSRSLAQMLGYTGLKFGSPTLSHAMSNLIPVFTYLLAIIFSMEDFDFGSSSGVAKLLGALVSVLGAFIIALYKGKQILMTSSPSEFPQRLLYSQQSNWALGGLLLASCYVLAAMRIIFQTAVVREFPEKITIVFFFCFFSTILCGSFSLLVERNPNKWKLRPDIELIAITCSEKGPVFVAMFSPLGIAIAVAMGVLFLGDHVYFGSVVGAIIITLGFYTVMWGKAKERRLVPDNRICAIESSSERTPLLHDNSKEEIQRNI